MSLAKVVRKNKVSLLQEFLESPDHKDDGNYDVLLALRIALMKKNVEIIKMLEQNYDFNVLDQRTVGLAAECPLAIWEVVAEFPNTLKLVYTKGNHPLTIAFRLGNYEVAKWMKKWADDNNVPRELKEHALYEAAEMGHVDVCKLYTVSDKYLAVVIKSLVKNGHSDKVKHFTRSSVNDFSHNEFEMVITCSAHFDALCAILRHPSVQEKVNMLPEYIQLANEVCKDSWEHRKKEHMGFYAQNKIAPAVKQKIASGMDKDDAMEEVENEFAKDLQGFLRQKDLDHYVYKF
jgi:hypothetical protein